MKKQLLIVGVLLSFAGLQAEGGKIMQQGSYLNLKDLKLKLKDLEPQPGYSNSQMETDHRRLQAKKQRLKIEEGHYMETLADAVTELCQGSSGQACRDLNKANKNIASLKKDITALNQKLNQ